MNVRDTAYYIDATAQQLASNRDSISTVIFLITGTNFYWVTSAHFQDTLFIVVLILKINYEWAMPLCVWGWLVCINQKQWDPHFKRVRSQFNLNLMNGGADLTYLFLVCLLVHLVQWFFVVTNAPHTEITLEYLPPAWVAIFWHNFQIKKVQSLVRLLRASTRLACESTSRSSTDRICVRGSSRTTDLEGDGVNTPVPIQILLDMNNHVIPSRGYS